MRRARKQEGFTLIEAMVALFVFAIALLGLVALQKATISGTNRGRDHTAATNIANLVMAQIRTEAGSLPLPDNDTSLVGTEYPYLNNALGADGWVLMPTMAGATVDDDAVLNHYLMYSDNTSSSPEPGFFCINYRVDRFTPVGGAAGEFVNGLYQARVRVTWPRWGQFSAASPEDGSDWKSCAARLDDTKEDLTAWERVEIASIVSREYTSKWQQ